MDSQHRHELQENVLADKLGQGIEAIKPHLPMIVLGAVGAAVGLAAWNSYQASARESKQVAWQAYSIAMDKGASDRALLALEQVGEDHGDSTAADWAEVTWADGQTLIATRAYLRQRPAATEAIEKAQEKYTDLLADGGVDRLVKDRARLGLARLKDLQGEVEEARKLYEEVGGAFKEIAEARAEELATTSVADDAKWLASADSAPLGPRFSPGGVDKPDSEPDPLALPDEEPSGDESFSEMLRKLQAAGLEEAEDEEQPAAEDSASETGEDASEEGSENGSGEAEQADDAPADAATAEEPTAEAPSEEPAAESSKKPSEE